MIKKMALIGVGIWCLGSASAYAHTSFMRPNAFDFTQGRNITIESSFTEDFSNPEVGVKSGDWHYIAPNGVRYSYDNVVELKQTTILENTINQSGTYKFSTGERLGRKGKMIQTATGELKAARGENGVEVELAKGETFVTSQTATVANVYVSKGAPTDSAVNETIGRLVFHPLSHPNELYVGESFQLKVTFDGQPMADQDMELLREGGHYSDDKGKKQVTTNSDGLLDLSLEEPGVYLLYTRHRAEAPAGSETDIRSYSTSLTFEVTR